MHHNTVCKNKSTMGWTNKVHVESDGYVATYISIQSYTMYMHTDVWMCMNVCKKKDEGVCMTGRLW